MSRSPFPMHPLLKADQQSIDESRAACSAYLLQRFDRLRYGNRFMPREMRADLEMLMAWHQLLQESGDSGCLPAELLTWRALINEAFQPEPTRGLARALRPTIRDHSLPQAHFEEGLAARAELRQIGSFETRPALLRQARQMNRGAAQMLLKMLGKGGERQELLADALACALQLIHWLESSERCLEQGYLPLAIEDLTRHGLSIMDLRARSKEPSAQALVDDQIKWIRELLAKGWPLCMDLGWYRGRLLAFILRLQAARLGSLENAGSILFSKPKRAGWIRVASCLLPSICTRKAPLLAHAPRP